MSFVHLSAILSRGLWSWKTNSCFLLCLRGGRSISDISPICWWAFQPTWRCHRLSRCQRLFSMHVWYLFCLLEPGFHLSAHYQEVYRRLHLKISPPSWQFKLKIDWSRPFPPESTIVVHCTCFYNCYDYLSLRNTAMNTEHRHVWWSIN